MNEEIGLYNQFPLLECRNKWEKRKERVEII